MSDWDSWVASLPPETITPPRPSLALTESLQRTNCCQVKHHPASVTSSSGIFLPEDPFLGRASTHSPRACREGSWSCLLPLLLLLQERFSFFRGRVHLFSHSVEGKETKQRVNGEPHSQQQTQRSSKGWQKTGPGAPNSPCREISCKANKLHLLRSSSQRQSLHLDGREKNKGEREAN